MTHPPPLRGWGLMVFCYRYKQFCPLLLLSRFLGCALLAGLLCRFLFNHSVTVHLRTNLLGLHDTSTGVYVRFNVFWNAYLLVEERIDIVLNARHIIHGE